MTTIFCGERNPNPCAHGLSFFVEASRLFISMLKLRCQYKPFLP